MAPSDVMFASTAETAPQPPPPPPPPPRKSLKDLILEEPECEFCRDTRRALFSAVRGVRDGAASVVDATGDAATGGVKAVASRARRGVVAARDRVDRFVSTGVAHAAATEERVFGAIKGVRERE